MDLTPEVKASIDAMTLESLLRRWRFAPVGDLMFQGESGEYFSRRMTALRSEDNDAWVHASKHIGW